MVELRKVFQALERWSELEPGRCQSTGLAYAVKIGPNKDWRGGWIEKNQGRISEYQYSAIQCAVQEGIAERRLYMGLHHTNDPTKGLWCAYESGKASEYYHDEPAVALLNVYLRALPREVSGETQGR